MNLQNVVIEDVDGSELVSVDQPWTPADSVKGSVTVKTRGADGKKINLTQAHNQWAFRPADQRFWTLGEMKQKLDSWKYGSEERTVDMKGFEVVQSGDDLLLIGGGLRESTQFTNWSFSQLAKMMSAPADYLRTIPADIAAKCLNHGIAKICSGEDSSRKQKALIRNPGGENQRIAALTGTGYSRIWNADIVGRLMVLEQNGWKVPPARPSVDDPRARKATAEDVLNHNKNMGGAGIQVGDMIAPAGLYASDRDCFVFMVSENRIDPGDGGEGINRGFFVKNSEVGDCSFHVTTFGYDGVCGNHIVWGATDVIEVSLAHRGRANERWIDDMKKSLAAYANQGSEKHVRTIQAAMKMILGKDADEVVEAVFAKRSLGISKRDAEAAFSNAIIQSDLRGNKFAPSSVWGMVCGLTALSQTVQFANQRTEIDRAASKLLAMAG